MDKLGGNQMYYVFCGSFISKVDNIELVYHFEMQISKVD